MLAEKLYSVVILSSERLISLLNCSAFASPFFIPLDSFSMFLHDTPCSSSIVLSARHSVTERIEHGGIICTYRKKGNVEDEKYEGHSRPRTSL